MNDLINLFTTLAQIDSPSGEESEIVEFVSDYLRDLDLISEVDKLGNIYCRIGNKPNPVLFCAHMDTVEPGRGIEVIEDGGFLQSAGNTILGGDDKASLSSILFSLKNLIERGEDLNLELTFSVREETDSGIQQIDKSKFESKVGFVFDGGDGELGWLCQSAPTIEDFKIDILGQSAHASRPEQGVNALEVFLNLRDKIKLGRPDEFTTLNIGLVKGGYSTNTVPEIFRIEGDLRSTNQESFNKYKKEFIEAIEESCREFGATAEFNWIPYSIGYNMDPSTSAFNKVKEIYTKHDIKIAPNVVTSGSDAAFLNSIGVETFCLGDGVIDAHKLSERIEIKNLSKLSEIVEDLMLNFNLRQHQNDKV